MIPKESHPLVSTVDFDFEFCITTDRISSADELFANGKILPVQIKKCATPETTPKCISTKRKKMLKELLSSSSLEEEKPLSSTKPLSQFRRSSSLNCDNGQSIGLIRSNSAGSAQTLKPYVPPRPIQRQNSKKEPAFTCSISPHPLRSSSKRSSIGCSSPLRKSGSVRSYASVRISPVLNIPPTYISKAALFGLSSFFCNGKSKKKKK